MLLKKIRYRFRKVYHNITGRCLLPRYIIVDVCNICNLRCPLCVTGLGELGHKQCVMPFDKFRELIDKMKGDVLVLSNWGEPLLNKDIFRIINYAKQKGFYVKLDTNFSVKTDPEFIGNLISCGLDEITISLDGCTEDAYSAYHVGGDFHLVTGNMEKLIERKRVLKVEKPKIVWKFVVNRYNEHEVEEARVRARHLGIAFHSEVIGLGDNMADYTFPEALETRINRWWPSDIARSPVKSDSGEKCPFLFNVVVVTPDGKVFPCCYIMEEKNAFGDLSKEPISRIWNNELYRSSRNLFCRNRKSPVKTVCFECPVYSRF